jgi:hypothetical protein
MVTTSWDLEGNHYDLQFGIHNEELRKTIRTSVMMVGTWMTIKQGSSYNCITAEVTYFVK